MTEDAPRVVIADDNPAARMILVSAVTQAGFVAVEVEDGRQAVEAYARLRPDLVILDVLMPRIDGFEACSRIRSLPGAETVPILLLTSLDDVKSIEKAYEAGATDFAFKPMNCLVLAQRARYLIRGKHTLDALRWTETRLTHAQKIAELGNWEWDPRADRFHLSGEARRLTEAEGCSVARFEDFLALVHADDRDAVRRTIEECLGLDAPCTFEMRVPLPDGSPRFLHGQAEVLKDPVSGSPLLSGTIQNVTERILAEERIRSLAYYDSLTGLPNRYLLNERLAVVLTSARRSGGTLAVLFLDIDMFKRINDTLGHSMGDMLLQSFADRLRRNIRNSDTAARDRTLEEGGTVARLGGDEFIVILSLVHRGENAANVARRIVGSLQEPFHLERHEIYATASIGISVFPDDGDEPDALLRSADAAMYEAKRKGRNNYQFYNKAINASALSRLSLESSLRKAIAREEFILHYQPIVDGESGLIVSVEALIRWMRPGFGLVMPLEFVSLAEETGLIAPIGEWSLRSACVQGRAWHEAGHAGLRVATNLSARQFRPETAARIREIVLGSGIDPGRLELEITESTVMEDPEQSLHVLHALRELGVRFAIDDFGTGYSSLSYLGQFPIDTLKIDRSFIQHLSTERSGAAISVAIIGMARALGIEAVAEGVETPEQRDFLLREGCRIMQGYLFHRPVPAEQVTELLDRQRVGVKPRDLVRKD